MQTWKKEVLSKELFIQCRPVGAWQVWRGMGWDNTSTDQSHTIIYRKQKKKKKICILFKNTECQHRLICPFLSFCHSGCFISQITSSLSIHCHFPNLIWAPYMFVPGYFKYFPSAASKIPIYLIAASRAEMIWHCHEADSYFMPC